MEGNEVRSMRKGATPGRGDLSAESLRSFDPENDECKSVALRSGVEIRTIN